MSVKKELAAEIAKHIGDEVGLGMLKPVPKELQGDYSIPIFGYAKKKGENPVEFAKELANKLCSTKGGAIKKAEAVKGFINISIERGGFAKKTLSEIFEKRDKYGAGKKKGKKILLEHTSANPDAPLHIGHLRNSVIGDCTARLLRFYGYDVETQFYLNDMGGQLAILANHLKGKEYRGEFEKSGKKPDVWMGEKYVEANKKLDVGLEKEAKELQKAYENGDKEAKEVIDFIVDTCVEGFKQSFEDFGVGMDSYVKESRFVFGGEVKRIIEDFKKTEYWCVKNEVSCVDLEKFGIEKEIVLMRSDGTSLYTTRDMAYHRWKLKNADICVNVIANEQTLPQRQLRKALEILGEKGAGERIKHLSYELVNIPGMRMSSRKGEFISADELLAEGIRLSKKEIEGRKLDVPEDEREVIGKAVAMGAIKYNMAKISPLKIINFKWDEALNFEGDSSPYLQYAHARATRILEKTDYDEGKADFSMLDGEADWELVMKLSEFPERVKDASEAMKISSLASYIYELAEAFNVFYFKSPVLDSAGGLRELRLMLVEASKQVMANGLGLLGIAALDRM